MDNPKVWIILLVWNNLKDTLECLHSLKKITYTNFEILLVDNGSQEPVIPTVKNQFPEIQILENKENLGFAEGNNRGIKYALDCISHKLRSEVEQTVISGEPNVFDGKVCKPFRENTLCSDGMTDASVYPKVCEICRLDHGADALFILNNDTTVDPKILDALTNASIKNPNAILGSKIYRHDKPEHFDHLGGNWNPKECKFDLLALNALDDGKTWEKPITMDYVSGCALFAPAHIFRKVGYLEPRFFLLWEESDWCFRAKRKGFDCFLCPEAKLWHKGSASFTGGKPHTTYFWWRNRLLWMQRNLSRKERWKKFFTVILPQIAHLYKLKQMQLFFLKVRRLSKKPHPPNLVRYKAACHGFKDYFLRKFGNAPSWIFKK